MTESKKGSCMSQSQNAIFTSPTGEENLMSSNHRDSESITGKSCLIILKCCCLQDNMQNLSRPCMTCHDETSASLTSLVSSGWINLSIPWSPFTVSKPPSYAVVPCLCLTSICPLICWWAGTVSHQSDYLTTGQKHSYRCLCTLPAPDNSA